MSKSKGNVIDPDTHVQIVGADCVKMYLAFMGPYGETANYPWDMGGIAGIRRFLERVYGLRTHVTETESENVTRLLHKTIAKVNTDVPQYKFNTAISAMMIFLNTAEKEGLCLLSYTTFLKLLAPFAPHLTEELWQEEGNVVSIHKETFPIADSTLTEDTVVKLAVQINGKMRGTIEVTADAEKEEVLTHVRNTETLAKYITGEVLNVVYVPRRIINIIVK
jgi:leucyl-tRNA synthetase